MGERLEVRMSVGGSGARVCGGATVNHILCPALAPARGHLRQ